MARFTESLPTELIKGFQALNVNTDKMLGDMCKAGAEVAKENIKAKMPRAFRLGIEDQNIITTKVYKTYSDDAVNCQAMIQGYFTNRNGQETPAPLVANMFEYGSSKREYPKQPFFRSSFNKNEITKAMLKVQEDYIKGLM